MKKSCFVIFIMGLACFVSLHALESKAGYAGADTCKSCHEDHYNSYIKSNHGMKMDPRTPAAGDGCETCHGPGAAHADAGGGKGVGNMVSLGPQAATSAAKQNEVCLNCHTKGKTVLWHGSVHEKHGLACSTCHSIHGGNEKNLAKKSQAEVCAQCHKDVKAQLLRSSHHPIREGKVSCADCHNPHGSVTDKLVAANSTNEKCYECHAEKRGPYLWEHPVVSENCMSCHTPHGSNHEKLLVTKGPFLCQRCHSDSRHPGTLYAQTTAQSGQSVYGTVGNRLFYRACQNCHVQIHGSNHPSGKTFLR